MTSLTLEDIATASPQECAALLAAIAARLATVAPEIAPAPEGEPDELIDAKTAAQLLKLSVSSVQHRAKSAPLKFALVQSLGRGLRFSRRKLERLITRQAGVEPSTTGLRGINTGRRRRSAWPIGAGEGERANMREERST